MTNNDDRDEPGTGPEARPTPGEPLTPGDLEAAWKAIVENYGERPVMGEPEAPPATTGTVEPVRPSPSLFDRTYLDALDEQADDGAPYDRQEHFVPPEPPPVPRATPARTLAWVGLFGAPLVMLVAVIVHLALPMWLIMFLGTAFIGGFVFLVATMQHREHDGFGGDDGAVV
jgi:hypothetical protein